MNLDEMNPEAVLQRLRTRPWAWIVAAVAALVLALLVALALRLRAPDDPFAYGPDPDLPDFTQYTDVKAKKQAFFDFLLPLVEARNDWVREQRGFLADVRQKLAAGSGGLSGAEERRLAALAERYRVTAEDLDVDAVDLLLYRVDEIPPSLALAQAASESAWGASRFARNGNNLFGEWCFDAGCGLVPQARDSGRRHEVEVFESPRASVDSYFRNINSHPAYKPVRDLRAQARDTGRLPTGAELAAGIGKYSERGEDYIEDIRAIIRVNRLSSLDAERESAAAAPTEAPVAETVSGDS